MDDPPARQLLSISDILVKKSVWVMGGDGWSVAVSVGRGEDGPVAAGVGVGSGEDGSVAVGERASVAVGGSVNVGLKVGVSDSEFARQPANTTKINNQINRLPTSLLLACR